MFTGLIETTGSTVALQPQGDSARLLLNVGALAAEVAEGDSIAVNGCCLTVTAIDPVAQTVAFDLLAQTLRVTNLGDLQPGSRVNLERALAANARLGGHFVQGHVDTTLQVLSWTEHGQDCRFELELPAEHRALALPKGSICLNGVSLTVAELLPQSLVCWIIPTTHALTQLGDLQPGQRVNVEFDLLGKYVRHLLALQENPSRPLTGLL